MIPRSFQTFCLGSLILAGNAGAAIVDWFQLSPGATPGAFDLVDDRGHVAVSGSMIVGSGTSFPGFPAAQTLDHAFWSTAPETLNSETGNGTVTGFEVRVAPQGGGDVSYAIELEVPRNRHLHLAVGQLFASPAASTGSVLISTISDAGSSTITLLESLVWNNGVKAFTENLDWDGTQLSPADGADGESQVAFFRIEPLYGANAKIRLEIPSAYNVGSGDALTFAIGGIIPEPGTAMLAAFGSLLLLRRRR